MAVLGGIVGIMAIIILIIILGSKHVDTSTQATTPSDKLQIIDETVGTGTLVKAGDTVTVKYTGTLANGTVFDSTEKQGGTPATFPLGNVIQGWQQGIPGMKVGGKRKLIIPPALGYGAQGTGPIPGNATLTFEIELVDVKS